MCHELPGNFGGVAYSNRVLLWARLMMSAILEQYRDRKVYNCSDGVQIPRTLPRLAKGVKLATSPADRDRAVEQILGEVDPKLPGQLINRGEIVQLRGEFAEFYRELQTVIAEATAEGWDFLRLHDGIDDLLNAAGSHEFHLSIRAVNHGSFMTILQCGYFLARRLPEMERPAFMAILLASLAKVVERMAREVDGWLDGFIASVDCRKAA
jgi:hypothetical protein